MFWSVFYHLWRIFDLNPSVWQDEGSPSRSLWFTDLPEIYLWCLWTVSVSEGGKEAGKCKHTLKASLYLPLLSCRLHMQNWNICLYCKVSHLWGAVNVVTLSFKRKKKKRQFDKLTSSVPMPVKMQCKSSWKNLRSYQCIARDYCCHNQPMW